MLRLMRLPRGTNRNRTLRRGTEAGDEDVSLEEVQRVFRRFWRFWEERVGGHGVAAASSIEGGP